MQVFNSGEQAGVDRTLEEIQTYRLSLLLKTILTPKSSILEFSSMHSLYLTDQKNIPDASQEYFVILSQRPIPSLAINPYDKRNLPLLVISRSSSWVISFFIIAVTMAPRAFLKSSVNLQCPTTILHEFDPSHSLTNSF